MANKKNEGKIKAMLERRGIIRKVDDNPAESLNDTITKYNPDIKPIFDFPDESSSVKTAPRQPVPGMSSPSIPQAPVSEGTLDTRSLTRDTDFSAYTSDENETQPATVDIGFTSPEFEAYPTSEPPTNESEDEVYNQSAQDFRQPAQSDYSPYERESMSYGQQLQSPEPQYGSERPAPENYTERYLNIDELYIALALQPTKTDSIYLIEEYIKTLPDSLPDASRRDIVNKIISASGFDYDLLMGDGVLRVKMLKEYAERFARHTDEYVASRNAELDALEKQMQQTRRLIENRKDLHKRQFLTIEAEAQRLKEILTFISG